MATAKRRQDDGGDNGDMGDQSCSEGEDEEVEQEKRVKMEQEMLHGISGAGGLPDL